MESGVKSLAQSEVTTKKQNEQLRKEIEELKEQWFGINLLWYNFIVMPPPHVVYLL